MRIGLALAGALALALPGAAVQAHHSMSMFDQTRTVTVTGTVKKFQWSNPHCYIQLVAKDANGRDVEWSMELGAPMYLYARGWRPRTLKPGMEVQITAYPLRNGDPGGGVLEVLAMDGEPIGKNT